MEVSRAAAVEQRNESPRLLAWAVRHGEILPALAVSWSVAAASEPLLARATLLWPLLDARARAELRPHTRRAAGAASAETLAAWMRALQDSQETTETQALATALSQERDALSTWPAWAGYLPAASVAQALLHLAALPAYEHAAFLLALRNTAADEVAAEALLAAAAALEPEASDRVVAGLVPYLAPALLPAVRQRAEAPNTTAAFPALTLMTLARRLPPDEGLPLAFQVLLRAEETGAARLAEVSPLVPDPLVDEAVKRQRRAQSAARPTALASLAARTTHPAVRQRLFHEAYHETRFRRDVAEALRVVPLAAPFLPDEALQWTEALPTRPDVVSMLAGLAARGLAKETGGTPNAAAPNPAAHAFSLAAGRLTHVSTDAFSLDPAWSPAIVALAAAAPSDLAAELGPLAPRLPHGALLPFWEALGPRLPPALLGALLADRATWCQCGPAQWWNTALVDLVPPELVRSAVGGHHTGEATPGSSLAAASNP